MKEKIIQIVFGQKYGEKLYGLSNEGVVYEMKEEEDGYKSWILSIDSLEMQRIDED